MSSLNAITTKVQTKATAGAAVDSTNPLLGEVANNGEFLKLLESMGQEVKAENLNLEGQTAKVVEGSQENPASDELVKLLKSEATQSNTEIQPQVTDEAVASLEGATEVSEEVEVVEGTEVVEANPELQLVEVPNASAPASAPATKSEATTLKSLIEDPALNKMSTTSPAQQTTVAPEMNSINEVILKNPINQTQIAPLTEDQVMVKSSAVNRSPAIDLSSSEVDHQLLNFDDFVAHKNAVNKKVIPQNGYGIPQNKSPFQSATPDLNKISPSSVLENVSKSPLETGSVLTAGLVAQQANSEPSLETHTISQPKVMQMNKSQTEDQVITDISNYIAQVKTSKEPTVQMRVQHDDLGMLDIVVNKSSQNMVNISIGTQTQEAKNFFSVHQKDLISSLNQSGLQVSEFKLENSSSTFSNSKNGSESSQQFSQSSFSEKNFGSEQNQRRSESQRREELWDILREQEVA